MKLISDDYHRRISKALQLRKLNIILNYREVIDQFDKQTEKDKEPAVSAEELASKLPQIVGNSTTIHLDVSAKQEPCEYLSSYAIQ